MSPVRIIPAGIPGSTHLLVMATIIRVLLAVMAHDVHYLQDQGSDAEPPSDQILVAAYLITYDDSTNIAPMVKASISLLYLQLPPRGEVLVQSLLL